MNLNQSCYAIVSYNIKVITSGFPLPAVPAYYLDGNRFLSVLYARIRNKCSRLSLNGDLFRNYLRNSKLCMCLVEPEDADLYFLRCNLFVRQRQRLFNSIQHLNPLNINDLSTLWQVIHNRTRKFGTIFILYQSRSKYIQQTGRFN